MIRTNGNDVSSRLLLRAVLAGLLPIALTCPAVARTPGEERVLRVVGAPEGNVFIVREGGEPGAPPADVLTAMRSRNFLGVRYLPLTPELLAHFGIDSRQGALIAHVEPDSPAGRAGIAVGDVVTAVGEAALPEEGSLGRAIAEQEEGATIDLEIWRGGRPMTMPVTLESRSRTAFDVSKLIFDTPGRVLFRIDPEALEQAETRLREVFEDPAWRERARRWAMHEELQRKVEELERRLERMQRELERSTGGRR